MKNGQGQPIAILGGMGPDASARLYQQIINLARSEYHAQANHDYPEVIIHSIPVPDFISDTRKKSVAENMLIERVKQLSKLPISCFGIACNTVHILLPELQRITNIPFIDLPDEVARLVKLNNHHRVGLLATPITITTGLYQNALSEEGIEVVTPTDTNIKRLGNVVKKIVSGDIVSSREEALAVAESIKKQNITALILGCTELPLVFPKHYYLPVFDSLTVLAKVLLKRYYMKEEK
ncbi:hypothetical protein A3A66_03435 [Microgenomates group bacterium RIFCSPLOWO2_01_FULL_46_13]|nr:MAG: hypothetical protein A2783_04615 [Microgenomates group bacterium RIFCSPHIGHO2_01_FULL_45_11]OGV95043.1 MAG: hypothetical protein A3A66_03435 [Microgenomates group bacterium RIFCSPLOWO2_01_FULL_46_13]